MISLYNWYRVTHFNKLVWLAHDQYKDFYAEDRFTCIEARESMLKDISTLSTEDDRMLLKPISKEEMKVTV